MKAALKKAMSVTACAGRNWVADNATTTGASLAFFCAFSLAPLLVILLTIAGWIVGDEMAYAQVALQLNALFGPSTAKVLMGAVRSAQHMEGVLSMIISAVTLLIGATTVLAALQTLLQQIWKAEGLGSSGVWGWLRTRFLSLGFILALGFLLLVSLTISTGISAVEKRLGHAHPTLVGAAGALDVVVSLALVSLLFALIFRYMPSRRLPWRVVAVGGVITALLFNGGRWVVSLYLAHSTQPTAFGAAASFAALLLWLYYTSLIFLFGAELTACWGAVRGKQEAAAAGNQGSRPLPAASPGARHRQVLGEG